MSAIKSSLKFVSFVYDFAIDGGAIGSMPMKVFLPAGSRFYSISVMPGLDLVSAGAAQVDIGYAGVTKYFLDNSLFFTPDYTVYNAATFQIGTSFLPNPFIVPLVNAIEVLVTISVAPLTAGKFTSTIIFIEY